MRARDKDRPYDINECLAQMLDSAAAIERYIDGILEEAFLGNQEKQDAVIRRIQVLGEAANRIMKADPNYATNFPELPLPQIYAMRNKVAHGYDGIDVRAVWNTAIRDVPILRTHLVEITAERRSK